MIKLAIIMMISIPVRQLKAKLGKFMCLTVDQDQY